ncbi:LAAT1 protein, partial [Urocynchramus pylzowi]|nr:LAAT1 protein [Urocynchramus pylzowi]
GSPSLRNLGTAWIVGCGALSVTALCQLLLRNQQHSPAIPRNNVNSYLSPDLIEMPGFICGCVSCVFLGSRFPQLRKNLQRRCTKGTFYLLFALALMGRNCTCGLSLLLKMPKPESSWALCFVQHLPWLVGSFGILFLNILVSL